MSKAAPARKPNPRTLPKCPTGVQGLDEITGGGLPRGRPTLVCGSAGCGKTLLAMEFLVRGVTEFGEPGVFVAFEENAEELTRDAVLTEQRQRMARSRRADAEDGPTRSRRPSPGARK